MKRLLCIAIATTALLAGAVHAAAPPSSFSARVTNPWFPLKPGARWVYTGVREGQPTRDVVAVTHRVRRIAGVPCISVSDRLYVRGHLRERTTDWYSQDRGGTVWYFGENTAELDAHGRVTSTEGSWQAGVDGARPGIFMPARPRVGESHRQEYLKGEADDWFEVIARLGPNALLTKEWTPLEPGAIDHKMYARGTGTVLEQAQAGGDERAELVAVSGL